MKKSVVTTISGPRYEDEEVEVEAAAAEVEGVEIDMNSISTLRRV
jgi:hypothetical protein